MLVHKRVEAKLLDELISVDLEIKQLSMKGKGIVRDNQQLLKYGDQVSIYRRFDVVDKEHKYYIAMTYDDFHDRVKRPIVNKMLAYAKKLHQMPIKAAILRLLADKNIKTEQVINFMKDHDDCFALGLAPQEPEAHIEEDVSLFDFSFDVLVRTKEVGHDDMQTHIFEGVIWNRNTSNIPSENPVSRINERTEVLVTDDHDGDYNIVLKDEVVDQVLKYYEDKLREQLIATRVTDSYDYNKVQTLIRPDNLHNLDTLCIIGNEDELVKAIMRLKYSHWDRNRLSYWQIYLYPKDSNVDDSDEDSEADSDYSK